MKPTILTFTGDYQVEFYRLITYLTITGDRYSAILFELKPRTILKPVGSNAGMEVKTVMLKEIPNILGQGKFVYDNYDEQPGRFKFIDIPTDNFAAVKLFLSEQKSPSAPFIMSDI